MHVERNCNITHTFLHPSSLVDANRTIIVVVCAPSVFAWSLSESEVSDVSKELSIRDHIFLLTPKPV